MSDDALDARVAAADRSSGAAGGSPVQRCSPEQCAALWSQVQRDVDRTAAIPDPIARNDRISAQYASLYQSDPRLQWVGLASVVSRQAGCAMLKAKDKSTSWNPLVAKPAGDAYAGLAAGNKTIYSDIYPAARFYHDNGLARLKACNTGPDGKEHVSPKLVKAFEDIDQGTPEGVRRGSDAIADYEQRDIVQDQVYSNERYRRAFESNEYWAKNPVGRFFGATPAQLPLSSTCTDAGQVPFEGSITDPDARVRYYNKLMNSFSHMPVAQRGGLVNDIVQHPLLRH